MSEMVDAICKEIVLRKSELPGKINSVYMGGGTPSLLSEALLMKLFDTVHAHFLLDREAEITIEANPDDLTPDKISSIRKTPVNRFSMGVQSFFDEDLKWMNRAHTAAESEASIMRIQDAGFSKISIDLIYGGPTLTHENWLKNLEKVNALNLNHVSAYCLTAEPETALQHQIIKGKLQPLDEEKAAAQFDTMVEFLERSGFEQYEISNFARNREYAVHNTSYWQNKPYLGAGPSAHSFNGSERSWNISRNQEYIQSISNGIIPAEKEMLTLENRINEYIMTGLRTTWGCDNTYILGHFGRELFDALRLKLEMPEYKGKIEYTQNGFKLARQARILADGIAASLFF